MNIKNITSDNDIIHILENLGFRKGFKNEEGGFSVTLIDRDNVDIEVFLRSSSLKIQLTNVYIRLLIYNHIRPFEDFLSWKSWRACVMEKRIKKSEVEKFKKFLLLSICRESFIENSELINKTNYDLATWWI